MVTGYFPAWTHSHLKHCFYCKSHLMYFLFFLLLCLLLCSEKMLPKMSELKALYQLWSLIYSKSLSVTIISLLLMSWLLNILWLYRITPMATVKLVWMLPVLPPTWLAFSVELLSHCHTMYGSFNAAESEVWSFYHSMHLSSFFTVTTDVWQLTSFWSNPLLL